jgi:molybdopterin converting factor small subunit
MPEVQVKLYATFRQYLGGRPSAAVEIEPGETVGEVLERLGVPSEQARLVFVDAKAAALDHPLQGGEQLAVFPAIAGG